MILPAFNEEDNIAPFCNALAKMFDGMGGKHSFVDFERPERLHGETHYPLINMKWHPQDQKPIKNLSGYLE